ncbi:hypothetical protein LDENG_00077480 [Lucifuga dentata]|nr:hypothetical protein LDENG_00077480 [Lucifuga dentata]
MHTRPQQTGPAESVHGAAAGDCFCALVWVDVAPQGAADQLCESAGCWATQSEGCTGRTTAADALREADNKRHKSENSAEDQLSTKETNQESVDAHMRKKIF